MTSPRHELAGMSQDWLLESVKSPGRGLGHTAERQHQETRGQCELWLCVCVCVCGTEQTETLIKKHQCWYNGGGMMHGCAKVTFSTWLHCWCVLMRREMGLGHSQHCCTKAELNVESISCAIATSQAGLRFVYSPRQRGWICSLWSLCGSTPLGLTGSECSSDSRRVSSEGIYNGVVYGSICGCGIGV